MSAWAGLISTYGLQEVLLRFLLSLYFSPDYRVCKWSQFWLRTRAQVTKYRAHSPRRGWSRIALSHVQVTSKPKRWHLGAKHAQHLILAPGASESSVSPYPRLLYHSAYHPQLLLSTLFVSLHKRFIISSEIEIGTVIQLFTMSASRVDLRLYAASACRALSANTARSTQRGSDQVVNSALEQIGNCSFRSPSSPPQLFSPCFFPPI